MEYHNQSQIRIQSALAERAACTTSSKYQFFNTRTLIDKLFEKKWKVYSQIESKTNNPLRIGFQRHMIIFKNEEYTNTEGDLQVVIRNAHDSTASVEIFVGFMRILCSNQLFTRNLGTGSLIRINHNTQNIEKKVLDGFQTMIDFLPVYNKIIHLLRNKILTKSQKEEFARRGLQLRFQDDPDKMKQIGHQPILSPRRREDMNNSAWTVFNCVQENLIKGGIPFERISIKGKNEIAHTRPLRGVSRLPEFNDSLLDIILEISEVG